MTRTPPSSILLDTVGGFEGKLPPKDFYGGSIVQFVAIKLTHLNRDTVVCVLYARCVFQS